MSYKSADFWPVIPRTSCSNGSGSGWRVSTTCQRSRKAARPPRPINDTWITGCCQVRNLPLATLNLKEFKDFADHDELRVIGVNER